MPQDHDLGESITVEYYPGRPEPDSIITEGTDIHHVLHATVREETDFVQIWDAETPRLGKVTLTYIKSTQMWYFLR